MKAEFRLQASRKEKGLFAQESLNSTKLRCLIFSSSGHFFSPCLSLCLSVYVSVSLGFSCLGWCVSALPHTHACDTVGQCGKQFTLAAHDRSGFHTGMAFCMNLYFSHSITHTHVKPYLTQPAECGKLGFDHRTSREPSESWLSALPTQRVRED